MDNQRFREGSVLGVLQEKIQDPRRREGRIYPLHSVLGMLLLAAMNGESTLSGMVAWGELHWAQIWRPLGFKPGKAPSYGAVWTLLTQLAVSSLSTVLQSWSVSQIEEGSDAIDIDGKYLRGSKRRRSSEGAMKVVSATAQGLGLALGQAEVSGGGEITAALALLQGLPLTDKVVTMDAGIMGPDVIDTVLAKDGACLGLVKGNHGEVAAAIEYWLAEEVNTAPPQVVETNKCHGRIEQREYWWTSGGALTAYLEQEFGWQGVLLCGRVRRKRRPSYASDWEEVQEHLVVYCSRKSELPTYEQCSHWLRQHWEIENRMFWVLDVTYSEDRNHARKVGIPLHQIRSWAISLIRQQGFRFIPTGRRTAAARPDCGLAWLC